MSAPAYLTDHLRLQLQSICESQLVARWVVAFSGGLDSTVLLHALASLSDDLPVAALHVNHQLSSHADDWQAQAQAFSQKLNIEFYAERVQVESSGRGLEDAAREARYRVFEQFLQPGDCLLMAHHSDDQAETLLLRLMRGTGPAGLAGIRASRSVGNGVLLRPLLDLPQMQLQEYALTKDLCWIEDDSNSDTRFDRNFLRAEIFPQLAKRWPGFQKRWQQTADHCLAQVNESKQYLAFELSACEPRAERWGQSLSLSVLQNKSIEALQSLLRYWLSELDELSVVPEVSQLRQIELQLIHGREDAVAQVHVGDVCLRRFNERLYVTPLLPSKPDKNFCKVVRDVGVTLPLGKLAIIGLSRYEIRFRQGGERCQPAGRRHSQTLKKLLQEYRLEPWLRPFVPLIYVDGSLVAVAGMWMCQDFSDAINSVNEPDPNVTIEWQLPKF